MGLTGDHDRVGSAAACTRAAILARIAEHIDGVAGARPDHYPARIDPDP